MRAGGNYGYEIQDINGTSQTMATIGGTGFTTPTRRHTDPYGNQLGTTTWNTGPDQHGFLGQPQTTVGITDIGARKYDPTTGKFLTVDPIAAPTTPRQNNGYTYGGNNPLLYPDPSGLDIGNTAASANAMSPTTGAAATAAPPPTAPTTAAATPPTPHPPKTPAEDRTATTTAPALAVMAP